MAFASSTPPKYDCEIFNEININSNKDEDKIYDENSYVDYSDKYLVFVSVVRFEDFRVFLKEPLYLSE